jgi:FAD/FMN-containing dehydrogenase
MASSDRLMTVDRFSKAIARLQDAVGDDVVRIPDGADIARHSRDYGHEMPAHIAIPAIAYPRSTEHVSRILAICHDERLPVTPQGGMTGVVGGAVPNVASLPLSLERMRAIEALDVAGATITVQAGTVLQTVQEKAAAAGLFFPLDLGGRGSAQIGGNVSTNAGGNRVLRYGMMRELVLGLEAVLADGTVIRSLNTMLKNNAGYDVKQLFIGTEGTLGIITRVVLRLFPEPRSVATGLVAVRDYAHAVDLMREAKSAFGGTLAAFEAMWPDFYRTGTTGLARQPPLPLGHGLYVLVETLGTDPERDRAVFEETLAALIEQRIAEDAVIATSEQQRTDLWAIRDCPAEFPNVFWPQVAFDISLPAGKIGDFVSASRVDLEARWPEAECLFFGHIADCNLHLSVRVAERPLPLHAIEAMIFAKVGSWGGSISAEHGIGTAKKDYLHHSRSREEITLMRQLKSALDPRHILNPGKVI